MDNPDIRIRELTEYEISSVVGGYESETDAYDAAMEMIQNQGYSGATDEDLNLDGWSYDTGGSGSHAIYINEGAKLIGGVC